MGLVHDHPRAVLLDTDVLAAKQAAAILDEFPGQFIEVGVAEANTVGMAAGLCSTGEFVPVVVGATRTLARRAMDQIADVVDGPKLPVKFVAVSPAFPSPADMRTRAADDLAALRTMPNMTVVRASRMLMPPSSFSAIGSVCEPFVAMA